MCAASPRSTRLPWCQRSLRTVVKLSHLELLAYNAWPSSSSANSSPDPRDGLLVGDAGRKAHVCGRIETGRAPDVLVHLDDEGRTLRRVRVAVDLHRPHAGVCMMKNWKASKTRSVPSHMYLLRRPSSAGRKTSASTRGSRVDAVGPPPRGRATREILESGATVVKCSVDASSPQRLLQHLKQILAAHRREALAADGDAPRPR